MTTSTCKLKKACAAYLKPTVQQTISFANSLQYVNIVDPQQCRVVTSSTCCISFNMLSTSQQGLIRNFLLLQYIYLISIMTTSDFGYFHSNSYAQAINDTSTSNTNQAQDYPLASSLYTFGKALKILFPFNISILVTNLFKKYLTIIGCFSYCAVPQATIPHDLGNLASTKVTTENQNMRSCNTWIIRQSMYFQTQDLFLNVHLNTSYITMLMACSQGARN